MATTAESAEYAGKVGSLEMASFCDFLQVHQNGEFKNQPPVVELVV